MIKNNDGANLNPIINQIETLYISPHETINQGKLTNLIILIEKYIVYFLQEHIKHHLNNIASKVK